MATEEGRAGRARAARSSLDHRALDRAFDRLEAAVDAGRARSAVLAVATAREVVRCAAFHRGAEPPVTTGSVHLLASLSKPIAAVAAMQLVDDGLLALDEPVAVRLAGVDPRITPRHLLTHSSGLPEIDWPTTLAQRPRAAVGLAAARDADLLFPPGTRFAYSTLSFFVLAELMAELTGVPYPVQLHTRVCGPLGMTSTSFDPPDALSVPVAGITAGTGAGRAEATAHYRSLRMPGAGLWSTAPDLVRFGQALLVPPGAGGLLSCATRDLMIRDHTAHLRRHPDGVAPVGYGLGWRRGVIDGRRTLPGSDRVFEHDGATGGELWIDPELDLVIVHLSSAFGADPTVWQDAVTDVYRAADVP